jgi:hypothetical protein
MTPIHFRGEAARRFSVEATGARVLVRGMLFHQTMRVTVRDARYPVELDVAMIDGKPACTGIGQIQRQVRLDTGALLPLGPPLTGELLRKLPVQTILTEAASMTAIDATPRKVQRDYIDPAHELELEVDASGQVDVLLPARSRAGGLSAARKSMVSARAKPHRGKRLADKELAVVAEVYRRALRDGEPPTQKVMDFSFVSRSTAGRWVQEARKRGILGPAPQQGVGGETTPT